jgi:hypothetical protein
MVDIRLQVRAHEQISYDIGGLRIGENVSVAPAGASATADKGGPRQLRLRPRRTPARVDLAVQVA